MKNILIVLFCGLVAVLSAGCCSQRANSKSLEAKDRIRIYTHKELHKLFQRSSTSAFCCPCNNEVAIKVYEQRLKMLKTELQPDNNISQSLNDIIYVSCNFEFVTGIKSEGDRDYTGIYVATLNDVDRWSEWLEHNKQILCWNEKKNVLYVSNVSD